MVMKEERRRIELECFLGRLTAPARRGASPDLENGAKRAQLLASLPTSRGGVKRGSDRLAWRPFRRAGPGSSLLYLLLPPLKQLHQ